MDSDTIRATIERNAEEIRRLKARVDETVKRRDEGGAQMEEWSNAVSEFNKQYDDLAFPGGHGYSGARERIRNGDHDTIEWAVCFLECRPYFFRSGYMYKDIMRVLKNAPMSSEQRARADEMKDRYQKYLKSRKRGTGS